MTRRSALQAEGVHLASAVGPISSRHLEESAAIGDRSGRPVRRAGPLQYPKCSQRGARLTSRQKYAAPTQARPSPKA